MIEQITYYAMFDVRSSRNMPRSVFRRVTSGEGKIDELYTRNLKWEQSPLFYAAERGDTMFEFAPITEEEAAQIMERIRAESGEE